MKRRCARVVDGDRLLAPGACDNGAGVVGMLAIAHALLQAKVELPVPLIFMGNVGEEGEGDLRGVRHLYQHDPLAGRIAAHIVLDGAGADSAVTQALGSRRYQVTINGPGGHSFTDAGTPNPIAALASALATLALTALPEEPRTTLNLGTIHGGTSVNSIPESAQASVDFRSTDPDQLMRLEVGLHRAVEDAVERKPMRRGNRATRAFWLSQSPRSATVPPRNCPPILRCSMRCAPSIVIWACAPICASARPTPIFLSRSAFRLSPWAPAEMVEARTLRPSGTPPKIAIWACAVCCC